MQISKETGSDVKGVWAILWRSLVFLPYMILVFVGVGGIWASRWLLPAVVAFLLIHDAWWIAGATLAVWLLAVWTYRRFRLQEFFEAPRSL